MRWVKRIALAMTGVVLAALIVLYGWSEWILRHDVGVPLTPIVADTSPAGVAEGARIAAIDGCMGCHDGGHGRVLIDAPPVGTLTSPAFASFVPHESDAQLARSIRQGVDGNGRQLLIMPSRRFLADDDTAKLIGFLRTLRPSPADLPRRRSFTPLGRLLLIKGDIPASAHPALAGGTHRWADTGAYFARTTCLGCHDLYTPNEVKGETVPPLAMMAASYDDAQFTRLLRTGVGLSRPDLGLMSEVARQGFGRFTDAEIASIHAYLKAQADKAPADQ